MAVKAIFGIMLKRKKSVTVPAAMKAEGVVIPLPA